MRPTFVIEFPMSPTQAIAGLTTLVDDRDMPIEGRIAGNHLMLVIPPKRRHFWSPWLNIEVIDHNGCASVKGRFSPNPSVWTGFMLTYLAMGTLVLFAALFGLSQWMMNKPPNALPLAAVPLLITVALYIASLIGQRMAQAQMNELYEAAMGTLTGAAQIKPSQNQPDISPV